MGRDVDLELLDEPVGPAIIGNHGESDFLRFPRERDSPTILAGGTAPPTELEPMCIGAFLEDEDDLEVEELEIVSSSSSASLYKQAHHKQLSIGRFWPAHHDEEEPECEGSPNTTDGEHDQELDFLIRVDGRTRQAAAQQETTMSTAAATTNLITCMIGASVLSLPRMVADSGWFFGPPLLALAGFVSYHASILLNDAVDATTDLCDGVRPRNMGEVVAFSLGTKWKDAVIQLTCLFQVSKCGLYFAVVGTNLHFWTETLTARQCTLVATSLGVGLAFIRNINTLSRWSIIGVVASGVYLFSIASGGIYAAATAPPPLVLEDPASGLWPKRIGDLPQIFAVMLYAYAPADVMPVLKHDMAAPDELPAALAKSHAVVASLYIALSSIAYVGWGRDVQGNVLQSMCSPPGCRGVVPELVEPGAKWWTGYLLSMAVVANLTVTTPIVLYCVFRTMEAEHAGLRDSVVLNRCMRLAVVLVAVGMAIFVPYFIEVLAVLATALLMTLQVLLPSAVTLSLSLRGAAKFGTGNLALLLLGTLVMIVGLRTSIANLLFAISHDS